MTKIYTNDKSKNPTVNFGPRKETIAFLLNYSKALHVNDYQGVKCELLLN